MAMFGQPQKKEEKPKLLDTPSIQKQSDLANTKSAMLTDRLKAAYAPPSEAALSAEAGKTYQTAMDKASPYQAEFLRSNLGGDNSEQLGLYGDAQKRAMELGADARSETLKTQKELQAKQQEQVYKDVGAEESTQHKRKQDLLFDKIPKVVGAGGVALNHLAESGFLDDVIGVGGGIVGGALGMVTGGPAGAAAGFAKGKGIADPIGDKVEGFVKKAGGAKEKIKEKVEEVVPDEVEEVVEKGKDVVEVVEKGKEVVEAAKPDSEEPKEPTEKEKEIAELKALLEGTDEEVRERLEQRRAARDAVGEGGFEAEADEEDVQQVVEQGSKAKQLRDNLAGEPEEYERLEEADDVDSTPQYVELPDFPESSILDVEDFNKAAQTALGSNSPEAVNAAYVALGFRPPNNAQPSPEDIEKAKASIGEKGSQMNELAGALAENPDVRGHRQRALYELMRQGSI